MADSEEKLCRPVSAFGRVCERRKLRVNVGKSKVMRCSRDVDASRISVRLNGELLEEVQCFKYLGSQVEKIELVETEVKSRVKEGCKVLGALKSVMRCSRDVDASRIIVRLNGELLEEKQCFEYMGFQVKKIELVETEVKSRVKEGFKVLGALKSKMLCRSLGMEAKIGCTRGWFS